jgi:hypothetical protein
VGSLAAAPLAAVLGLPGALAAVAAVPALYALTTIELAPARRLTTPTTNR